MNRIRPVLILLSSTKVILLCLILMMFLVVFGTISQIHISSFEAQQSYFNSFLIFSQTPLGISIPVFPGGLSVGILCITSLISSILVRNRYNLKQAGLLIVHGGLIILIAGQLFSQIFSEESQMPIQEGQTLNYSIDFHRVELAIIKDFGDGKERTVVIPQAFLKSGEVIKIPELPFSIRVKELFQNSKLVSFSKEKTKNIITEDAVKNVHIEELPANIQDSQFNIVSAYVEILNENENFGIWLLSSGIKDAQIFQFQGTEYHLLMRPRRNILPFTLTLKDFSHELYPGTDVPRHFSSLLNLKDPKHKEDRDVLIYMNHPLRYGGYAFYQASFGNDDMLSVLQVVRNPMWVAPYLSSSLILIGLAIHFGIHLLKFDRFKT
ncbi:MAG: hypothetical protein GYA55_00975 [SAR324 cluster bacterium]|uniref:ResB-like domain-containing protein n=1 Tax=SAR324 cluster bacterium TaxID=2024889 RepID=A0A7X9FP26_9DELT|nr:hypothetical protein [SAR324 cluster bacterium]